MTAQEAQNVYSKIANKLIQKKVSNSKEAYKHLEDLTRITSDEETIDTCIRYYFHSDGFPQDMTIGEYIEQSY